MKLLLDTLVLLWWDSGQQALNDETRAIIASPANQVFVSAASIWEIAIKCRLKKLEFRGSPAGMIAANGFLELPILPIDAEEAGALRWDHNDPFDRMLVAQAQRLGFTLATADSTVRTYAQVAQIWAA